VCLSFSLKRLLLVLVLVLACVGCSARHKVDGDLVRSVSMSGNAHGVTAGQNDSLLRSVMEQGKSPFGATFFPLMFFVPPVPYVPSALVRDAYRIEVFYAHHGWFDATFRGWAVFRRKSRRAHRGGVVDVHGLVDPGQPTLYDADLEVRWTDESLVAVSEAVRRINTRSVQRRTTILEGLQFDLDLVNASRAEFLEDLRRGSFAYADVEVEIDVRPDDKTAHVVFLVDSGPASVVGKVRIHNPNGQIDSKLIHRATNLIEGRKYRIQDIRGAQGAVFGLGAFSVVSVEPDLSDRSVDQVPIDVHVVESKFRTLRLGGGLEWEGNTLSPRLSSRFEHINAFDRLVDVELEASVGAAWDTSDLLSIPEPLYRVGLGTTWPGVLGPKVDWMTEVSVERDLLQDQLERRTIRAGNSLQFTLRNQPKDRRVVSVGPEFTRIEFPQLVTVNQDRILRSTFGASFDQYLLATVAGRLLIDLRDDPVNPKRGKIGTLDVAQALPIASDFTYTQFVLEGRAYAPFGLSVKGRRDSPLVLAGRARGMFLQAWNNGPVPWSERLFLGGSSDLRGFRLGQLGKYDCICLLKDEDALLSEDNLVRKYVAAGGVVGGLGALEMRYDMGYIGKLAVFGELGMLGDEIGSIIDPDRWRFDVGVGYRYDTVVGPIRFDVSMRPIYPEDAGPVSGAAPTDFRGEYIGCGGFEQWRAFDLGSSFGVSRTGDLTRSFPAINIFLTIGEAI
jgi:outer membrane protein assembly factor BamA